MNMAPADISSVQHDVVTELTLIPNLQITAENLQARFGTPDRIEHLDDERDQYNFNAIGLQAIISKQEPATLHFSNPPSLP